MLNEMQQRALRYRELARHILDDDAREVILQIAAEYDHQARLSISSPIKLFDDA